ncbi:hypothetical protein VTN31DRAFT_5559 [Thermomyces dupontii]|uniref:uncharacterized protein n=1 Tax=Talaromyces thermophilus TaxID=28565 RepID=UPI0037440A3D
MSSEHTSHRPARRRPSMLFRVRPRTATAGELLEDTPAAWSELRRDPSNRTYTEDYTHTEPVLEETGAFPEPVVKHRPTKSFSNIRHGVDGLRALGHRLSVSILKKSSRGNLHHSHEAQEHGDYGPSLEADAPQRLQGGSRIRSSINRRPSLSALQNLCAPLTGVGKAAPIMGLGPPVVDFSSGSAARAATAAQNELFNAERVSSRTDSKFYDRPERDSESGIGIDLRERSDSSDADLAVVRTDPVVFFPPEIMAQILSYLDPESLMRTEAVSRAWHKAASSRHVWRHVYRREFGSRVPPSKAQSKVHSAGLGKTVPNQDWKRIFLIRQALERRWRDGKAAAIYLQGHTDSVYCVQFDEKKIITGSRDRTIRIWDAHYPWPCLKIIGANPNDGPSSGPGTVPATAITPPASGSAPMLAICPQVQGPSDVASCAPRSPEYHNASILCLQYDDEIMVTGSSDHTCIVWDVKDDYKPIRRLVGHKAGVLDVCFDDRYIVSCSKDTTICVWDRHTGELVKKLLGHRGPVNAVQLRGDLVVSASGDGIAKLWNITSGLCIREFSGRDRGLACVEFSDDARTILAGGNDQVIYQFDANTGELIGELKGHSGLVRSLYLDSINRRIVSGSYDMSVKVFDADTGELTIDLPGWTTSWMLSAKSDYRRIVATSQDSRTVIMDFGYGLDGIELLEEA